MKKIITADTVRTLIRQGDKRLSYCETRDLITPEARDLLQEYGITLETITRTKTEDTPSQSRAHSTIKPQFCGICPNFAISDRELIYFRVIERLRQQYPNHQTDESTLRALIEPILNRYLPQ